MGGEVLEHIAGFQRAAAKNHLLPMLQSGWVIYNKDE